MPQLVNLRIQRLIIHQVFPRNDTQNLVPPTYSTQFTPLSPPASATLQNRVVNTAGDQSYCIEMAIVRDDPGSVYSLVCQSLAASDDAFMPLSRDITLRLAQAQTSRRIPGGIVAIFSGLVGSENFRYIGIIKAEFHEGFNLKEEASALTIEFLSKLLLTPQQKLYKIALFIETHRCEVAEAHTCDDFRTLVYDHNMTAQETRQAAKYFYDSFLGCNFSPTDKKLTSDFYHNTKEFISSTSLPDDTKLDLNGSLYSYLKVEQSNVVNVSEFANRFMQPELRDGYNGFMIERGTPPASFPKNIDYLKYKLRRRDIRFTSDVKISAPADKFDELISIQDQDENHTIVSIKGKLERER
ncbi:MAG: nucleoid-associated protein [Dehalococcoides mccartyi]|uniref:nucleoid-associated protein n=1 Tax=Dehalococcoides mccartyi TaxID=61435 RepID=UPI0030F5EE96